MFGQIKDKVDGFTKTDDGIYYKTQKAGSGPVCGSGKKVTVGYKLTLPTGQIVDASEEFVSGAHAAIDFTTGAGQMIPGFDLMVQEMKYGETRTIMLPPAMAYGDMAPQIGLPADTYLIFDIKLIK